ncbi:hypothetical protein HETIRDRAFT_170843 [Heterobasidion irregulare TC 32-1]|uniref:Uncharacterized protein n=1 Tax=Heterobasidion irregulare (strain TC 32-1) TaxID=747525 RepID=W4KH34_HETIT|nr:uncharacterized protein HETIRDRAFT_170843 [Heterobasidion irregulare TC 32-1]ETW84346.1 hypothetical protein HETIRDRAFT_170843 [Heterobasidion irregulare TC 32-1]
MPACIPLLPTTCPPACLSSYLRVYLSSPPPRLQYPRARRSPPAARRPPNSSPA